jgi:hypothetical protein
VDSFCNLAGQPPSRSYYACSGSSRCHFSRSLLHIKRRRRSRENCPIHRGPVWFTTMGVGTIPVTFNFEANSSQVAATGKSEEHQRRPQEGLAEYSIGGVHERWVCQRPFVIMRKANLTFHFTREASIDRTAQLLNSQAVNLDVADVSSPALFAIHVL